MVIVDGTYVKVKYYTNTIYYCVWLDYIFMAHQVNNNSKTLIKLTEFYQRLPHSWRRHDISEWLSYVTSDWLESESVVLSVVTSHISLANKRIYDVTNDRSFTGIIQRINGYAGTNDCIFFTMTWSTKWTETF